MKNRICAFAVVAICLSVLASSTLAYFTDTGTARNVITSNGIGIHVIEQQLVNGSLQPYPNQPIPVMPAMKISKIVSVQNMEEDAWVRMNYIITVYNAAGNILEVPEWELNRVIVIEPDSTHWTQKDGWWYYNTAVQSKETTVPLFEQVSFSGPDMDNKYQNCTVMIDVNAQAVQKANNGDSVMEALGWPKN